MEEDALFGLAGDHRRFGALVDANFGAATGRTDTIAGRWPPTALVADERAPADEHDVERRDPDAAVEYRADGGRERHPVVTPDQALEGGGLPATGAGHVKVCFEPW